MMIAILGIGPIELIAAASIAARRVVDAYLVVERAALFLQEEISRRANEIFNHISYYLKMPVQKPSESHEISWGQILEISEQVSKQFSIINVANPSDTAIIVLRKIIAASGNVYFNNSQEYKENPQIEGAIHAIFLGSDFKGITVLDDPFTTQQKKLISDIIRFAEFFFRGDNCPYMGTYNTIASHEKIARKGLLEVKNLVYTRKFVENPPGFINALPKSITTSTKTFLKMLNFTKPSEEKGEWALTSDCFLMGHSQ